MPTVPLQITFRHMKRSPALEARIAELAEKLDRFSEQILHCQVIVDDPRRKHRHGVPFEFHLRITLPGKEIAIRRAAPADPAHQDPYVALRDAFHAARRRIQDYERKRRLDVKSHGEPERRRIARAIGKGRD